MASLQFTFAIPPPGTSTSLDRSILCLRMKSKWRHDHDMPGADYFTFDTPKCYTPLNRVDHSSKRPMMDQSITRPYAPDAVDGFDRDIAGRTTRAAARDEDKDAKRNETGYQSIEGGYKERTNKENTTSESTSLAGITESLNRVALVPSGPSEMSPFQIRRALRKWLRSDSFRRDCEEREVANYFSHIDMNVDWNRARCELERLFRNTEERGTVEERVKIQDGLAQFSFSRQQQPLVLTEEVLAGMFEHCFVGVRREKSSLSREPGSWWGARKRVFVAGRGDLAQQVKTTVRKIKQNVDLWRERVSKKDQVSRIKSQYSTFADTMTNELEVEMEVPGGKRLKKAGWKSEEVMSEAWRAKRRLQEQKAGRWADGTVRMNRLWDGFHWVLNVDDPKQNTWGWRI